MFGMLLSLLVKLKARKFCYARHKTCLPLFTLHMISVRLQVHSTMNLYYIYIKNHDHPPPGGFLLILRYIKAPFKS